MNTSELFIPRGKRLAFSGLPVFGVVEEHGADFYDSDNEDTTVLDKEVRMEVDTNIHFNLTPEPEFDIKQPASRKARKTVRELPVPEAYAPLQTDPRKTWTRESTRVRFPQK